MKHLSSFLCRSIGQLVWMVTVQIFDAILMEKILNITHKKCSYCFIPRLLSS